MHEQRFLLSLCVAVGCFGVAPILWAQQEEPQQAPAEEKSQNASRPFRGGERMGNRMLGMVPLLRIDSVKRELKLEGDQAAQVESFNVQIREDFADDIRQAIESLRGADPADRQQFREKMAEIAAKVNERLDTVLNREQATRLRQIDLQLGMRRDGAAEALTSDDIAAALDLTPDQQSQLREQAQSSRRNREAKTLDEARSEVNDVLTSEQQDKLTNLLGEEFDLPAAMLDGGGRPRGLRNRNEGRPRLRQRFRNIEPPSPAESI